MTHQTRLLAACLGPVILLALGATHAQAYTAQEIVNSVIDELDNVADYSATLDVDYDNPEVDDMTGGILQWKRNSGTWKTRMETGTPYTYTYVSDGTVWNSVNGAETLVVAKDAGDDYTRYNFGTDLFNMEPVLAGETWSLDPNTETVNSVLCYRVYTTKENSNYEVWIDEATRTKIIRVKVTDVDDDLQWQLEYSDYSDVENTAMLPATIVTKHYANDTLGMTSSYVFSDIDINEGLSDSVFECVPLP